MFHDKRTINIHSGVVIPNINEDVLTGPTQASMVATDTDGHVWLLQGELKLMSAAFSGGEVEEQP